jgi:hypothetical protein
MKTAIGLFILFSGLAYGQAKSPTLDPNKYTVCAMTFNSTDEIELYKKKMDPKAFNPIVEITEFDKGNNWLQSACKSGIQCDQLIVSGHFAGSFFGEVKDQAVSLEELEKASCDKTCSGIFKNPSEVFLFGCNTLAGDSLKTRSPEQYLQVLREHHFDDYYAQQVVASSYGIQGKSNKVRMQNVFGDNKKIYGFNSIAPSGKTVTPFWNNYLNREKPSEHMDNISNKKAVEFLTYSNDNLNKSMCGTAFCSCSGISDEDPEKKLSCVLLDGKSTPKQKLFAIQDLMEKDNFQAYIPLINNVIEEGIASGKFDLSKLSAEDLAILKSLQGNTVLKNMILSSADKMTMMAPAMENITFLKDMGMITEAEFNSKSMAKLAPIFNGNFLARNFDIVCEPSLKRHFAASGTFTKTPPAKLNSFYKSAEGVQSIGCLGVQNVPEVRSQMTNILKTSPDSEIRSGVISSYIDQPNASSDVETRKMMLDALKNELTPAHVKSGNESALNNVLNYSSNLKRDGAIEQVMFSNLSRTDLNSDAQAFTLKFYSMNQPLSKDEKDKIKALILRSTNPNVQSWGRSFHLR